MGTLALFVPSLAAGGAERVMIELSRGFLDRGLPVDMVLAQRTGAFLDEVDPRARIVDLGQPRVSRAVLPLARYLRRTRPRALLSAMTHANLSAILAHRLARSSQTRLIVGEHSAPSPRMATLRGRRQRAMFALARPLYRRADIVVGVSQGVVTDLGETLGVPEERRKLVYNPVVSDRTRRAAAEDLDHPWFAATEPPVVLAVGRLAAAKDFPLLLRAIDQLRSRRPVRLVILGEGPLRSVLEDQIVDLGLTDAVALPGFDPNPHRWMARADAVVLSSEYEGFGNVLAEALATGAPVASVDCPSGPAEILGDGAFGHLAPTRTPEALAQAIADALDAGRTPEWVARRRERSLAFSVDAAVDGYLDAIGPP